MPSLFDNEFEFYVGEDFTRFAVRHEDKNMSNFVIVVANEQTNGVKVACSLGNQEFDAIVGLMTRNMFNSGAVDAILKNNTSEKVVKVLAFDKHGNPVDMAEDIVACLKTFDKDSGDIKLEYPGSAWYDSILKWV
ncbi:hypothetical protein GGF42_004229 [Coemansia sp. RSA 2424]|nr:hypothetical protein GGF42_004229 [Coemansia sp. RSA 2424]